MKDQILDDDFTPIKNPGRYKIIKWTSLILLWVGILLFGIEGRITSENYILFGAIFLSIASILAFTNLKLGVRFTFIIIFLGIFNLIAFFPFTYEVGLRFFEFSFRIDLILVVIGIIHYFTNRKEIKLFVKSIFVGNID